MKSVIYYIFFCDLQLLYVLMIICGPFCFVETKFCSGNQKYYQKKFGKITESTWKRNQDSEGL